jgi:hypothetical protein
LFYKPGDPKKHIVQYLENAKVAGTKPLITDADLDVMFGMFDITKRGTVTTEQATRALQVRVTQRRRRDLRPLGSAQRVPAAHATHQAP